MKQAKLTPVENNYLIAFNSAFAETLVMVENEVLPGWIRTYSIGYLSKNNPGILDELFTIEWREETNNYVVLIWNYSAGDRWYNQPDAWETECGPYKNLSGCFQKIFNTWNQIKLDNVLESVAMEENYKEELELESKLR